jgi:hypothetical protein
MTFARQAAAVTVLVALTLSFQCAGMAALIAGPKQISIVQDLAASGGLDRKLSGFHGAD